MLRLVVWGFVLCVPFVSCSPVYISSSEWTFAFDLTLVRDDQSPSENSVTACSKDEVVRWKIRFHECFMDRKYKDGGRNLNYIVDRIMEHAGACTELSNVGHCRPESEGFLSLLMIVIEQMKDYSQMYLEEIYKGRENIKDLKCVDDILTIKTYETCFKDVSLASNRTETDLQNDVQSALECVDTRNRGCSPEGMTTLNNIVRSVLSLPKPPEQDPENSGLNSGTGSTPEAPVSESTLGAPAEALTSITPISSEDYASSSVSPISSDYASSSLSPSLSDDYVSSSQSLISSVYDSSSISPISSGDYASSSISPISSGDYASSSLISSEDYASSSLSPISSDYASSSQSSISSDDFASESDPLSRRFDYYSSSESYWPFSGGYISTSGEYVSTEMDSRVRQMSIEDDEPPPEPQAEPEPTKRWYNYIIDPIVSAWNSVVSFFSNLFG